MGMRLPPCPRHSHFLEGFCVPCKEEEKVRQQYIEAQLGAKHQIGLLSEGTGRSRRKTLTQVIDHIESLRMQYNSGALTFSEFAALAKGESPEKKVPEPKVIVEEKPVTLSPVGNLADIKTGIEDWKSNG